MCVHMAGSTSIEGSFVLNFMCNMMLSTGVFTQVPLTYVEVPMKNKLGQRVQQRLGSN